VQAALGARHADVHQPPLLLDVAGVDRFAVRQDALLQPDEKHVRELEALSACSVDRHTASAASPSRPFEHRDQRDHLRQLEQVAAIGLALAREPADEIVDALRARLRVATVERRREPVRITDLAQQLVEQPARRLALGAVAQAVDQRTELGERGALRAGTAARTQRRTPRRTGSWTTPAPARTCATSPGASVVAPMPRFGADSARTNAGSSSSFAISRRYATMSLISVRSNIDCPPEIS
jgi:hypothetical protein